MKFLIILKVVEEGEKRKKGKKGKKERKKKRGLGASAHQLQYSGEMLLPSWGALGNDGYRLLLYYYIM